MYIGRTDAYLLPTMDSQKKKFSKIYDQYISKIYRFVFLKVNSQDIAQDLTSETFLRGWESFKDRTDIENPQAFLYQIARNLVVDFYREKGKANFVSTESTPIIDPRENLEEMASFKFDLDKIKVVLADLREDYQNVIIWHYLDDLPIQQVANMMDRSEDATRVLLHRALKSLKERLNSQNQTS